MMKPLKGVSTYFIMSFKFSPGERDEVIRALSHMEIEWGNEDLPWDAEKKAYDYAISELESVVEYILEEKIEKVLDNYEVITGRAKV